MLGLLLNESESKHKWMQIFDEIKSQGVEDVFFISMDGVSGLEQGAKTIFQKVVVQRRMAHLIRNLIKYVPSKDYKVLMSSLKKVYGAPTLKACKSTFETFRQQCPQYPGAAIRKIMYTTNAVEAVNSCFRKVTKKALSRMKTPCLKYYIYE